MKELQEILRALRTGPEPGAWGLATLVRTEGHSYRRPGARLLMQASGPRIGALSGGCLEADVYARWREDPGRPRLLRYDLRGDLDLVWGTGAGCEGVADVLVETLDPATPWLAFVEGCLQGRRSGWVRTELEGPGLGDRTWGEAGHAPEGGFVERVEPPIQLWILGAGDDARPLVRLAQVLGWRIGVADPRPAFATRERFPAADVVRAGPLRTLIPDLGLDARTAVVLLTHHYARDLEALRLLLPSPAGYVGVMGHRLRGDRLLADLEAEGLEVSAGQRTRLHHPVGLDLGGDGPEAIALAILAEVQAVMAGRRPLPLRERMPRTEPS
ncbi:MAG: XdhC family protein [Holophagaceae bacterium]